MPRRFQYYIPLVIQSSFFLFFLPIYKFFVHLEIKGKENLKNLKGPMIIAPNHTHELDPTVIPLITSIFSPQLPIYSVIYPIEKYNDSSFGWRRYIYKELFFEVLGGYPTYSGFHNYELSLENHIELLTQNKTVCIFPEGKCTLDGSVSQAHGGLAFLAFRTRATVVPLAIDTFYNISWLEFIFRKRKIVVTVLPPILSSELISSQNPQVEDFHKAGEGVLGKIKDVLRK